MYTDLELIVFYSMSEEERVGCGSALRKENLCPVLAEFTALYKHIIIYYRLKQ